MNTTLTAASLALALGTDSKNAAIARSTILLCRELSLSVVAEGAKTEWELA